VVDVEQLAVRSYITRVFGGVLIFTVKGVVVSWDDLPRNIPKSFWHLLQ
jgi:hypothetical protein